MLFLCPPFHRTSSFPQNIFSVQAATQNGGFEKDKVELVTEDMTMRFPILKQGKLYYLHSNVSNVDVDEVLLSQDLMSWHETLGHFNFDDVIKLENVVDGMKVVGKKTKRECETCVKGKMTNEINRSPRERVSTPLELVHTDLAGPLNQTQKGINMPFPLLMIFLEQCFVYFLKQKNKTVRATEQFLAGCAPYGKVKTIRSDNGTEFTSEDFSSLLRKNNIKHERSAPYSPHQNGTAESERQWRTIFEMGRCMLLDKKLPKELWPYAVHTAVYTRNRCLSSRVNRTPFEALTGRRPNISNMRIFGCEYFAYTQQHKAKLDERGKKGVFVGYDRSSPANLVYIPNIRKVITCKLVHFVSKDSNVNDRETQTGGFPVDEDDVTVKRPVVGKVPNIEERSECVSENKKREEIPPTDQSTINTRYPRREKKPPSHLSDYEVYQFEDKIMNSVDFCYTFSGFPQSYKEAIESNESKHWQKAMEEEMASLKENDTYTLIPLPSGKQAVGGRWV